jgi:hypothetical protein
MTGIGVLFRLEIHDWIGHPPVRHLSMLPPDGLAVLSSGACSNQWCNVGRSCVGVSDDG